LGLEAWVLRLEAWGLGLGLRHSSRLPSAVCRFASAFRLSY
jgi:hypothetical protein